MLTAKGLAQLVAQAEKSSSGEYPPYLPFVEAGVSRLKIVGNGQSAERIVKHLAITTASAFLAPMPSGYFPIHYDSGAGEGSQSHLLSQALRTVYGSKNVLLQSGSPYRFTSAAKMLEALRRENAFRTGYVFGRYSGLIEAPERNALVYVGGPRGMAWEANQLRNELLPYKRYLKTNAMSGEAEPNMNAILLVPNAKTLGDIWHDKKARRSEAEELGSDLSQFIAAPLTYEGREAVRSWLDYGPALEDEIIASAKASGRYEAGPSSLLPLKRNGNAIYVGAHIDLNKMRKLKRHLERSPEERVKILCYKWQKPYYEKNLGEIPFDTLTATPAKPKGEHA